MTPIALAAGVTTAVPPALVLFALAVVALVLPRKLAHGVAAAGALAVAGWLLAVAAGSHLQTTLFGFEAVLFLVDPFSRTLGVVLGFITAAGAGYSYTAGGDRVQLAYALLYAGSGVGAALAGDWLTLVVYWELMALFATLLLWHRTAERGVGIRYAIYHEIGGLALIGGVLLHYTQTGTFVYGDGITAGVPALLVALGIGLNAGFLGLHVWLVDAYPSTHVATSVVLAAVTTKVGAYALVRAFPDGRVAVAYVGGAMVLVGVSFAILQTDVRRLLSYHVVSQVGYMVAGFGAGSALASAGAMAHLVNNVLYKSLLFMVAGVLVQRTGTERLKQMGGLGRAMPLAAGAFAVAAFSIAGVPGFNGFVSKGMVLDGVQKAGLDALWWALLIGSVGTVISFAKFGYYAFLHGGHEAGHDDSESAGVVDSVSDTEVSDLSRLETAVLGSVALLCVLLGLAPDLSLSLLPADGVAYAKPFASKQFTKAGAILLVGAVAFAVIRTPLSRVPTVPDLDRIYHPTGRQLLAWSTRVGERVDGAIDRAGTLLFGTLQRSLIGAIEWPHVSGVRTARSAASIGIGILAVTLALVALALVLSV